MIRRIFLVLGLVLLTIPIGLSQANAYLMGQTLTADWLYPNTSTVIETHTINVGSGVELPDQLIQNANDQSIDVGDDYILYTFTASNYFWNEPANGWRFTDTYGTIPEITGYSIGEVSSGITGLENSDLSFTSESVFANFRGVSVSGSGDFIRLDVDFAPVPEPASMLLFASGLAAWAGLRKRFKK